MSTKVFTSASFGLESNSDDPDMFEDDKAGVVDWSIEIDDFHILHF